MVKAPPKTRTGKEVVEMGWDGKGELAVDGEGNESPPLWVGVVPPPPHSASRMEPVLGEI